MLTGLPFAHVLDLLADRLDGWFRASDLDALALGDLPHRRHMMNAQEVRNLWRPMSSPCQFGNCAGVILAEAVRVC